MSSMESQIEETATRTDAEPALPRSLDPRIVRLWRLELLGQVALLALVAAALFLRLAGPGLVALVAGALLALGGAAAAWLPEARFRAWEIELRERDLLLRSGVLWRSTSVVPHARIQHVDTRRGPLERGFGLARVVVFTAGNRGAALVVPGLGEREAEALRDRLAALGGGDDAL